MTFPVPAPYLEPESRNFGQRYFGHRGFGGLLEDLRHQNPDGTAKWIPQYNLQNFWRRQIVPYPIGLIEPLIPPRLKKNNEFTRLPGHFSFRTDEYELYNRNLLATRYFESLESSENIVKIWTVNERSKRKMLETFQVELDSSTGIPISESLKLVSKRKLKMTPPIKSDSEELHRKSASESILELRPSLWDPNLLFLRSPTLLQSYDTNSESSNDLTPIFHVAVKNFAESHLIPQHLAVVDYGGRIWMKKYEEDFEKMAANDLEVWQNAIFTDHPKILGISSNFKFELLDVRKAESVEIWKSREFEKREFEEPIYLQETPPTRAMIRHIAAVPGNSNNYLIMTDRAMHLVDDRFRGKPIFSVNHPIPSGAHRMTVSGPVKDDEGDGEVYSIFVLDQLPTFSTSISMSKIYLHKSGIFSSVDSFHSIGNPENFEKIIHRGKYSFPEIREEPTRAMSLLEISSENSNFSKNLLIRQTDDGAIWFQSFFCGNSAGNDTEKARISEEKKSFERIVKTRKEEENWKREKWKPVFSDQMVEEIREDPRENCEIVSIDSPDLDHRIISQFRHRAVNCHLKCSKFQVSRLQNPPSILPLDDVNSVLSKITLESWKLTQEKMKEET